ncbi:MAG: hypothetical protein IT377_11015 [Polyangiaceae bacterium]|nr:hypothetical protein [Polyangiaceae bacterium]
MTSGSSSARRALGWCNAAGERSLILQRLGQRMAHVGTASDREEADRFEHPTLQQRLLEHVPDNVRLRALAEEWWVSELDDPGR